MEVVNFSFEHEGHYLAGGVTLPVSKDFDSFENEREWYEFQGYTMACNYYQ